MPNPTQSGAFTVAVARMRRALTAAFLVPAFTLLGALFMGLLLWRVDELVYALALVAVELAVILFFRARQSDKARRVAEARLLRTIRATGVAPWERDLLTDRYQLAPEWLELLGYQRGEIAATVQSLGSIMHPDDVAVHRQAAMRCIETGGPYDVEFRSRAKDGAYRWFRSRGLPELDATGRTIRIAGALEDVTERRRYQDALVEAKDVAAEASRAKGEFLASMSHEIRTPMNGVVGMTELLLDTRLDATQRDYTQTIRDSAHALLTVINDVLDLSKIEAGKLDLDQNTMDLRRVINDVVRLLAVQALAKGIELRAEIDPAVPSQMIGDAVRIRQILINLGGNAIKFTERGEVAIEAQCISQDPSGVTVRCNVHDTGPGLSADQQALLFRPYSQVDGAATRRPGGTGLGLSIVRQLAGLMKGEAGVRSEVGRGSTFWFTAQLSTIDADGSATASREDGGPAEPAPLASPEQSFRAAEPRRVLVADDNVVNQKVASIMLRKLGLLVEVVDNGAEAVAAVQRGGFDLVLMDCQMPELDGFAATRAIRAQERDGRHMTIVALTASAMKGDDVRCREAGMDDYLTKPLTRAALVACLERYFGRLDGPAEAASVAAIPRSS
jgi:two-component system, sensor histidine kinase